MTEKPKQAMTFQGIHAFMRVLRWLVILTLVLLAAALIRLNFAPLSINFLKPFISDTLMVGEQEYRIDFDEGELGVGKPGDLKNDWSFLDLEVTGLRLTDSTGKRLLDLPRGKMRLSGIALLSGTLAPASLEVEGLDLSLEWQGSDIAAVLSDRGSAGGMEPIELLLGLLSPGDKTGTGGYLQRVVIGDARIDLKESLTGSQWLFADAELRFSRGLDSMLLSGKGNLSRLRQDNHPNTPVTRLDLAGVYNAKTRTSQIELLFDAFNPSDIAGDSETLTLFKAIDMPVSGALGVTFDENQAVRRASFDLVGEGGLVDIKALYEDPVRFDGMILSGYYEPDQKQTVFEDLQLSFVGATLQGDGLIYEGEEGLGARFFATVEKLPFQWLKVYWPSEVGKGAYRWVSRNLTAGTVTDGHVQLDMKPWMWEAEELPAEAIDFAFDFVDATAHYLRPMPPIQGGHGRAHLDAHSFELWAEGGEAGGIAIAGSYIRFDDIHRKGGTMARVDARLEGNNTDILALIDSDPLGYPRRYGLSPSAVKGWGAVDLDLSFPLVRDLTLGDVTFTVKADLDPLEMPDLFGEVGITDGKVTLLIDGKGIDGTGRIALNDVPFDLKWREDFTGASAYSSEFTLNGALSGKGWEIFSLPIAPYVDGPGAISLVLQGRGPSIEKGQGVIDFVEARLGFEELGWLKEKGEPAVSRFLFEKNSKGEMVLPEVIYEDAAMRASGSIIIGGERGLEQMVIDSLKVGETHLAATVTQPEGKDFLIAVTAESFDARPFIEKTFRGAGTEGEYVMPTFDLDIYAARVLGLNDVVLGNLQVAATYKGDRWALADMVGTLSGGGGLKFELSPTEGTDRRDFLLTSEDAGEMARALGLFENGIGGTLSFTGEMTNPGPDQQVTGAIGVDDFRIVTAPTLAQILSAGSLGGIRDLLAGDGIGFTRLETLYDFKGNMVTLRKARAWGPAIGLTMEGDLDIKQNNARLKGTIVPAYTANSILGKIPVLGSLLMGGKGQGLFAINYAVTGPLDEPDISVNPLSMLTPGFLRGIFGAFDSGPEKPKAEGKEPAPEQDPEQAPEKGPEQAQEPETP